MSSCIAGQDQRSAVAISLACMSVRVCRPELFKNLCLSLFQASPTSFFGTTPLAVLFPNLRLFDACCFYATPWFSFFLIRSDKNGLFTNGHRVCKMAVKTLLPVTLQSADRFSIVFIVDSKFYNILVFLRSQLILSMSLHYTTSKMFGTFWLFIVHHMYQKFLWLNVLLRVLKQILLTMHMHFVMDPVKNGLDTVIASWTSWW